MSPRARRVATLATGLAVGGGLVLGGCSAGTNGPATPAGTASAASASATPASPAASVPSVRVGAAGTPAVFPATRPQASTPLVAPVPGAARGRSVAVIGDSLTYQRGAGEKALRAELAKAGFAPGRSCWSGADGRTITGGIPGGAPDAVTEAKRCRATIGEPDVWVVALVTNDLDETPAQLTARMQQLLATIGDGHRVVWVNAGRHDTTQGVALAANDTVAKVVAGRPHTVLADWYGYVAGHADNPAWWVADGTHMTPAGYAVRNAFVAAAAQAALTT